jgi:hypothetical protein
MLLLGPLYVRRLYVQVYKPSKIVIKRHYTKLVS